MATRCGEVHWRAYDNWQIMIYVYEINAVVTVDWLEYAIRLGECEVTDDEARQHGSLGKPARE